MRTERYELRARLRCDAARNGSKPARIPGRGNDVLPEPSFSPYPVNAAGNKVAFHLSLFTFHFFRLLAPHQLIRQLSEILHDQVLA
jgi:hypothetical protein